MIPRGIYTPLEIIACPLRPAYTRLGIILWDLD